MKKLLIILLTILLLTGCSKKKVLWEDVQESFKATCSEVNDITSKMETIVRDDYQEKLDELKNYIADAKYDISDENQDVLKKAYKVAYYIEKLSSRVKSEYTSKLIDLAKNVQYLCKNAFEGNEEDFNSLKDNIIYNIDSYLNWSNEEWTKVELLNKIDWAQVEEEITQMDTDAWYDTKTNEEVSEYDLDDLKHIILDNYKLIEDGVTDNTNQIAKDIYYAAVQLESYARRQYNEPSNKVKEFALAAQTYVKQCYGKQLEESEELEKEFKDYAKDAQKWTQSTWNEIIAYLRIPQEPAQ